MSFESLKEAPDCLLEDKFVTYTTVKEENIAGYNLILWYLEHPLDFDKD